MTENRVFKAIDRYGAETEFELVDATFAEENEAEREYRKAYTNALKEGVLPKEKMREIMKEQGVWDDSDDEKLKKIIKEIAGTEANLKKAETAGKPKSECTSIAGELGDLRAEMWRLINVKQSVLMHCCENYATAISGEVLIMARLRVKATHQRYWKNYEEFVLEKHNERASVVVELTRLHEKILQEEQTEFLKSLPEYQWLQKIQEEPADEIIQKDLDERVEKVRGRKNTVADGSKKSTTRRKKRTKKVVESGDSKAS
jgi:hypothetical protein